MTTSCVPIPAVGSSSSGPGCVTAADNADNQFFACGGQHEAGANRAFVQEVRDRLGQLLDVGLAEVRQLRVNLHVDFDIAVGGGVHGRP